MAILLTFSLKHIAWQQDIRKGFKFLMYTLTDRRIGQSYQCKDSLMKKENWCRLRLRLTLSFRLLARQYIFQSYDSVTRLYSPSLYLLRWVFLCLFLPLLVEAVASKILWSLKYINILIRLPERCAMKCPSLRRKTACRLACSLHWTKTTVRPGLG